MKYPPILTTEQERIINSADFAQLYIWYNEVGPGRFTCTEAKKLWDYLNEKMKECGNV